MLIDGQFIQILVYFFEDEVWLVLLEDSTLEELLDYVCSLLVHRKLKHFSSQSLPDHITFFW